jgi:hypothetical protein
MAAPEFLKKHSLFFILIPGILHEAAADPEGAR